MCRVQPHLLQAPRESLGFLNLLSALFLEAMKHQSKNRISLHLLFKSLTQPHHSTNALVTSHSRDSLPQACLVHSCCFVASTKCSSLGYYYLPYYFSSLLSQGCNSLYILLHCSGGQMILLILFTEPRLEAYLADCQCFPIFHECARKKK